MDKPFIIFGEKCLATEILRQIEFLNQDLTFVNVTVSDGNCFYDAVCDQILSRPSVAEGLSDEIKRLAHNPFKFRNAVVDFFDDEIRKGTNKIIEDMLELMIILGKIKRGGIWLLE